MSSGELVDEFDECSSSNIDPTITFVDPNHASTFDCAICWEKLRNAVAVCDDHLFCEECVAQICAQMGSFVSCPTCRRKCSKHEIKRVKFIDRQIKNLLIKCPNHEITPLKSIYLQKLGNKNRKMSNETTPKPRDHNRERSRSRSRSPSPSNQNNMQQNSEPQSVIEFCDWSGKLDELNKHIMQCPFEIIRCSQCRECIERGNKDTHNTECNMFRMECSQCTQYIARKYLRHHQEEVCIEGLIKCGNCKDMVKRKYINVHYNECPEAVISCEYYQYGCSMMSIKRKDLIKHLEENMKEHLKLMHQKMRILEEKNNDLENKVNCFNDKIFDMNQEMQQRLGQLEAATYAFSM